MSASLALRILSGTHAGATATLAQPITLGTANDADVILTDSGIASHHATLSYDADGWFVHLASDGIPTSDNNATPRLAFGQPYSLGPIQITVDTPEAPWPDRPTETEAFATTSGGDDDRAKDGDGEASASSDEVNDDTTASALPATVPQRRSYTTIIVIATLVTLIFGVVLTIIVNPSRSRPTTVIATEAVQTLSLGQLQQAIERLGFASQLHVGRLPDQSAIVRGWVRDEAQRDALAEVLSRLSPMPAMRVSVEAEVLRITQDTLDEYSKWLSAQYLGDGRVSLGGPIASEAERTALLKRLAERVPGAVFLSDHLILPEALAAALTRALRNAGMTKAIATWDNDVLRISAVGSGHNNAFDAVIESFQQRYGTKLPFLTANDTPPTPTLPLPFRIRSVVSGSEPFIMVQDGTRILQGGTYRGYRLVSIDDRQIIFDGVAKVTIPR